LAGDIPPFNKVDKVFKEDDIRNLLGLSGDDSCADYYCHYINCEWALIEAKGSKIGSAVYQLEETAKKLSENGYKINMAIIVTDKISRIESRRFEIRENYKLFDKKRRDYVRIKVKSAKGFKRVDVLLVRRMEFTKIEKKGWW